MWKSSRNMLAYHRLAAALPCPVPPSAEAPRSKLRTWAQRALSRRRPLPVSSRVGFQCSEERVGKELIEDSPEGRRGGISPPSHTRGLLGPCPQLLPKLGSRRSGSWDWLCVAREVGSAPIPSLPRETDQAANSLAPETFSSKEWGISPSGFRKKGHCLSKEVTPSHDSSTSCFQIPYSSSSPGTYVVSVCGLGSSHIQSV